MRCNLKCVGTCLVWWQFRYKLNNLYLGFFARFVFDNIWAYYPFNSVVTSEQEQHVYSQISPRTRDGQKRQHVNHDYVDIEQMTTPVGSLESTMTEYYPMASNVFTPIQMTNPSSLSEITAMAAATQPTNLRR